MTWFAGVFTVALSFGLAIALAIVLPVGDSTYAEGFLLGLPFGLMFRLGTTAWGHFTIARTWLALRGRLPGLHTPPALGGVGRAARRWGLGEHTSQRLAQRVQPR